MGIGIVSDDALQAELDNLGKPPKAEIKPLPPKGRGDNPNVPEELRKVIGEEGIKNGRESARALAGEFGISKQSADAYMNGATSLATYNQPSSLTNHIDTAKQKVSKKARNKLKAALNHITDEKLESTDAKDLATIAKNMSGIVKDMEPSDQSEKGPGVQFVFFTPQMKKEESYTVIDAPE